MIMSGWILPDMHEVKCVSCSTLSGHIQIVKRYLNKLKERDIILYERIMLAFIKSHDLNRCEALDDFAVTNLGWIKILNEPINILFCSKNNELEFMTDKYIKLGYNLVVLENKAPFFEVDIPSKELI